MVDSSHGEDSRQAATARFSSLRYKLLKLIIVVSALFTLLATVVQLYFEYRSDVQMLNERIDQVRNSHLPALELSIWTLDTRLINTQLASLQSLTDVYAVHLSTRYGEEFKVGPAIDDKPLKRYTIDVWTRDAQPLELGTLVIFSDLEVVYARLYERGKVIVATLGVRTLFVSLSILFIVHLLVTRHLARLADYLEGFGIERLDLPFSLQRRSRHTADELDTIAAALDNMRQTLKNDVDELYLVRRQLEQSESKYRMAMNATRDGLWDWDIRDGRVDYSPVWASILGEPSVEPLPEAWQSRLHPEDRAAVLESLHQHLAGATTNWKHEYRLRRNDGQWIWVLSRGEVVERDTGGEPLRMLGTLSDIHALKLSEQAHREAEERVTLLLNSTAEAIYGIDLEGLCTFVNPACLAMLGYESADELIGRNMHDLLHPGGWRGDDVSASDNRIQHASLQGVGMHVDDEVLWRKDGSSFPVEYWSYPIRKGDQISGAVVTFLDITERLHDKQVLEHLATHDSLTGVSNRKHFDSRLAEELVRAKRYRHELSLIMLDIDFFKRINDRYGHPNGDRVLQAFARVIEHSIRQHDCAGRYGGEEFIILLPETSLKDAIDFAERLRKSIEALVINIDGAEPIGVTASFGVSCFPQPAQDAEQLLNQADQAMYQAKKGGRNTVRFARQG